MNFKDLATRLKAIEEGALPVAPTKDDLTAGAGAGDEGVAECGGMEIVSPGAHEQQDNVSISINMNGQGAGGIQDLMAILKHLDKLDAPASKSDGDVVFGQPGDTEPEMGAIIDDMGEEYENSAAGDAGAAFKGIDAVTQTGDDLASKGAERLKVSGGGNPMQEELLSRLADLYQSIKEGEKKEKEPEGTYSSKRQETDSQRIARLAREKRQAQNKERMKNDFNAEMERE